MATSAASSPSPAAPATAPGLSGPHMSATAVDMTPEKGFFKAMWAKVVDVYTATFKAEERLDRMNKMPKHQREIAEAAQNWRDYSNALASAIRADVKTLGNTIGNLIEKSGDQFANAMKKLNEACEEITGYKVADLTPSLRRDLSVSQRAKLSRAYSDMKAELASSKTPYVDVTNAVKEIGTAVAELVHMDTQQRGALKVYDKVAYDAGIAAGTELAHLPKKESVFGTTDLLNADIQAVAPIIDQKLEAFYAASRAKAFEDLAQSEGVKTGAIDKIKDAIAAAKSSLQMAGALVNDVVKQATAMVEHHKKNDAIRQNILSGIAPTDPAKTVAYVSQSTLDDLNTWFRTLSQAAETAVSGTFAATKTDTDLQDWVHRSADLGNTCEQYRKTLKAVGDALSPLTPIMNAATGKPPIFVNTVDAVNLQLEQAAVYFVTTLPHDKAMEKLAKLAEISAKVVAKAQEDLASGGALTQDQSDSIKEVLDKALTDLKKTSRKSWL